MISKSKSLLRFFSVPLVFSILIIVSLVVLTSKSIANLEIIFGIALGVVLGFIADIFKNAIEDWTSHTKLINGSLKLLKEDAKEIYSTLKMYGVISTSPDMPKGTDLAIPFEIEMKYWQKLNERTDFLYLGSEEPFDKIFKIFFEFQNLKNLIRTAKENESDTKNRIISIQACKIFLEENKHEKILKLLMTEKEMLDFKNTAPKNE